MVNGVANPTKLRCLVLGCIRRSIVSPVKSMLPVPVTIASGVSTSSVRA
jgi:hypothetical protein